MFINGKNLPPKTQANNPGTIVMIDNFANVLVFCVSLYLQIRMSSFPSGSCLAARHFSSSSVWSPTGCLRWTSCFGSGEPSQSSMQTQVSVDSGCLRRCVPVSCVRAATVTTLPTTAQMCEKQPASRSGARINKIWRVCRIPSALLTNPTTCRRWQ